VSLPKATLPTLLDVMHVSIDHESAAPPREFVR
jgi:hypothetical protein